MKRWSRVVALLIVALMITPAIGGAGGGSALARFSPAVQDSDAPEPPDADDDDTPPEPPDLDEGDEPSGDDPAPEPPDVDETPESSPTPETDPTEAPARASSGENEYEDTEAGWSLAWDDSWEQAADPATDDGLLALTNGTSFVYVYTLAGYTDARACVRDQVAFLVDGENVSSVSRLTQSGEIVRGGDEAAAFGGYRYNFRTESATVRLVNYFDCRILRSGTDAVLAYQVVPLDNYGDEAEAVAALLADLTIAEAD